MKIISKMLVGALALAVTNVYAAELMTGNAANLLI